MADLPISGLTLKSLPFASSFTNPATGALLEVLDQPDTTMAATGTNKRVAPGDLIYGFLAAGTNVTLTETSGIVTVGAGPTGLMITQHAGTITTDTESAGAVTCNLATSDWHLVVLNANVAIAVSNPTVGQQFTIVLQQASTAYSVTSWFTGSTVNWVGSPYSAPTMPATNGAYLTATFKCISSGVYLAWWLGNSAA